MITPKIHLAFKWLSCQATSAFKSTHYIHKLSIYTGTLCTAHVFVYWYGTGTNTVTLRRWSDTIAINAWIFQKESISSNIVLVCWSACVWQFEFYTSEFEWNTFWLIKSRSYFGKIVSIKLMANSWVSQNGIGQCHHIGAIIYIYVFVYIYSIVKERFSHKNTQRSLQRTKRLMKGQREREKLKVLSKCWNIWSFFGWTLTFYI